MDTIGTSLTVKMDERLFLIQVDYNGRYLDVICNLHHIPLIFDSFPCTMADNIKIQHYWNRKFRKMGRKALNEMLKANQIDYVYSKSK